jgi:hypothetical protein
MQTLTDQERQAMGATRNKELGYWEKDGRPISNLMDVQGFAGITLSDIGGALFRNVVYDYQNPLFGSHLAEAATLIPGGKLFKWGGKGVKWARRLFRAEEAAEAAAKVTRATHLIPTHGSTLSRRAFQELKESIARDGIREPIKFVEVNGQKFVDGHHRLRAARELGIVDVPIERVELPYAGYNTIDDLLPW